MAKPQKTKTHSHRNSNDCSKHKPHQNQSILWRPLNPCMNGCEALLCFYSYQLSIGIKQMQMERERKMRIYWTEVAEAKLDVASSLWNIYGILILQMVRKIFIKQRYWGFGWISIMKIKSMSVLSMGSCIKINYNILF